MSNNIVITRQSKSKNKVIPNLFLAKNTSYLVSPQNKITQQIYNVITHKIHPLLKDIFHLGKGYNYNVITRSFYSFFSTYYLKRIQSYYKIFTNHKKYYYNVITFLTLLSYPFIGHTTSQHLSPKIHSEIIEANLIYGQISPQTELYYNNTKIPTNANGDFVFALPQDAPTTLTLTTKDNQNTKNWSYTVQKRRWKEEVVNGLPPKKISPSTEDQKRITQENKLLKKGRSNTFYTKLPLCFSRPVDKTARISSAFGSRRILNGIKTTGHSGTDYALPTGTPIYAPADGVIKVTHPDMFYSGKTILIDHGYGLYSSYSHMNTIFVEQGDIIKRGDKIGEIGTTGRSTGPHLHFTMTWFNTRVDPEFILTHYPCDD